MKLFILVVKFMLFSGVLFYIFNFNLLMMMLLGLEYLLLIFSWLFLTHFMMFFKHKILKLNFFIFCISESVLGLTIFILMVREFGKDFLTPLMIPPK
uniref:NADH dehydrogenase subunit 4L n=1 Tax=Phloeomyzus passerinii TaxID=133101 RepID=A0A1L1YMT2_9HEMI|nr:NADH dehydrogenase subunit 4L [Phloeomyzus passerinii]